MALHRHKPRLLWALALSLLLNATVLIPGAYYLLFANDPPEGASMPGPVEVELVEPPTDPRAPAPSVATNTPRPPRPEREEPPRLLTPRPSPPPQPPEEKKRTQTPRPPDERLKMVEVHNPESEKAPKDARYLSDKNRQVEEETRARHTNLDKDHPRPEPRSDQSRRQDQRPGSDEPKIAEDRERPSKSRKEPKRQRPGVRLSMRAPSAARDRKEAIDPKAEAAQGGELHPGQRAQKERRAQRHQPARPGEELALDLDHRSLDRIDGEGAAHARRQARLSPSKPQGSHDRKWRRIRAALENFIPEVKPGNQTALGTRADPFALYIARMHRKIHRLWGFGILVDLEHRPRSHPLNDRALWTKIEIAVLPNGEVGKATIVKPSGVLPYDVAALDTVFSAAPYPPTPPAIRSADGRVYMHWRFHRDQRQCGTFGVDPFILTTPGTDDQPQDELSWLERRDVADPTSPRGSYAGPGSLPRRSRGQARVR